MIDLGLTTDQRYAFQRTLTKSHLVRVIVAIRDANEVPIGQLAAPANTVLAGSVEMDVSQDVTRRCALTVLDPEGKLTLDVNSPSSSSLWPSYFISVEQGHYVSGDAIVPSMQQWVDVPVFWGPLTKYTRKGGVVTLEAMGKELLGLDPFMAWVATTIKDQTLLTTAIHQLLDPTGELRYLLPDLPAEKCGVSTLYKGGAPWLLASTIASNHTRQLFYDGLGRVRLRTLPADSIYTFRMASLKEGWTLPEPPVVQGVPSITYDFTALRNVEWVQGPLPLTGSRIEYTAFPGPSNPLSPTSMARHGKPRYMVRRTINDQLVGSTAAAAAKKQGDLLLTDDLQADTSCQFDSLLVPHLEENDMVTLSGDPILPDVKFKLTQFTLPLTIDSPMSVGYIRRVPVPPGATR